MTMKQLATANSSILLKHYFNMHLGKAVKSLSFSELVDSLVNYQLTLHAHTPH